MHMSGFMSTLVRVIVRAVLSLSSSVILAGSLGASASLVNAYSTVPARGGSVMAATPIVALDDVACANMALCFVIHVRRRRAEKTVPISSKLIHARAVLSRRLFHGFDVVPGD